MGMSALGTGRSSIAMLSPAALLFPILAATTLMWVTSPNPVETSAGVYAFFLLLMPWGSYLCWRQSGRTELPMFAMVAGAYWVYFALPLFWGARSFTSTAAFAAITPSEITVTDGIWMALIGVMCLWAGMRIPVSIWAPAHLPDIVDRRPSWAYVRAVLVVGVVLGLFPGLVFMFGADARQIMTTLTTVVPGVAFVLLFNRYLDGEASRLDLILLVGCGAARLLGGLASGWLGPTVAWGVTCGALVLLKRRNLPWKTLILTTLLLLFLQVGKNEFRGQYWGEETNAGTIERVQFWIARSASLWGDALQSQDRVSSLQLASKSLERASLLMQVAHVLEMTPSQVPFQEGQTYRFMAVTFVPRLFWPDKPSINEANKFYQVAYGLTTERGLQGVSIAVGSLAEGFINFGWAGVIGIMLLLGIVLGIYQRTFLAAQSSTLFLAIGLTLIPGFLAIESQLGQYLGGVVQQTLLTTVVFLPIVRRRARVRGASSHGVDGVAGVQVGGAA
jgi:hypothetical protein